MHDAAYFRLSRAEAVALDPQTRVLLEVRNKYYFSHPYHVFKTWGLQAGPSHLVE